ncbi:MAG: hypothetical protein IJ991_07610 [Thermoguttaceae bacterium]|nr:hypothetical protein [Thermoguttaceae bacterium]
MGTPRRRRASKRRLANSSTNAGTSGGQASNPLPFSVDRAVFAGRRRAVSDVFPSSAAFPEAELNQQRSETRR